MFDWLKIKNKQRVVNTIAGDLAVGIIPISKENPKEIYPVTPLPFTAGSQKEVDENIYHLMAFAKPRVRVWVRVLPVVGSYWVVESHSSKYKLCRLHNYYDYSASEVNSFHAG